MNCLVKGLTRLALAGGLAVGLAAAGQAEDKTIHLGFQKYGTLILLKTQGLLEQTLEPQGYSIRWTEFPAGPQLLEALNVGAIDFGTTGEAPPIFAQAAGAPLVYVGYEPPAPQAEAILVPKDSPLQTVADLKGKTVALNKGSNVHYLLVKALEHAGLSYSDVEVAFLPPADARAAFEKGAVDAWVIWEPFLAAAEAATGARQLADGRAWWTTTSSTLRPAISLTATRKSSRRSWNRSPRSTPGSMPTVARLPSSSRLPWASQRISSRSPFSAAATGCSRSRPTSSPPSRRSPTSSSTSV